MEAPFGSYPSSHAEISRNSPTIEIVLSFCLPYGHMFDRRSVFCRPIPVEHTCRLLKELATVFLLTFTNIEKLSSWQSSMMASAVWMWNTILAGSKGRSFQASLYCVVVRVGSPPPVIAWSCALSKIACGQRFSAPTAAVAVVGGGNTPTTKALGPPAMGGIVPPVGDIFSMVVSCFPFFPFQSDQNWFLGTWGEKIGEIPCTYVAYLILRIVLHIFFWIGNWRFNIQWLVVHTLRACVARSVGPFGHSLHVYKSCGSYIHHTQELVLPLTIHVNLFLLTLTRYYVRKISVACIFTV